MAASAQPTAQTGRQTQHRSTVAIPVRTPNLRFDEPMPMYWFRDNAFLTFLFDGFNLTFPEGERFFVRAVHDHLDQIDDPVLREQVRGFSGQEGQHARIHERLFDALRDQGFDLDDFFRRYDRYLKMVRKRPAAQRLASTAALEHYTAMLAQVLFETDLLERMPDPMRKLLVWHAAEELEHRAVAFDVLRATHPGYLVRAWGFWVATLSMFYWMSVGMRLFIEQSGTPRARMWKDFRKAAYLTRKVPLFRTMFAYLRPGFHPSERGSLEAALERLAAEGLMTEGSTA